MLNNGEEYDSTLWKFGGATNVSNMIGYTDTNHVALTDLSGVATYTTSWTAAENIADFVVMDGDFVGAQVYEECVNVRPSRSQFNPVTTCVFLFSSTLAK